MSFQKVLIDGALNAIARLHPELDPFIAAIIKHEPQIEQIGPILYQAAIEGPGAVVAAEKAAPDLVKAVRDFVAASAVPTGKSPAEDEPHVENVLRDMVGAPRMTPEEERSWIDRMSPPGDSRAGSG